MSQRRTFVGGNKGSRRQVSADQSPVLGQSIPIEPHEPHKLSLVGAMRTLHPSLYTSVEGLS